MATVEHIYPKMDIRRWLSEKTVLACYKCNHGKSQKDYANVFNNGVYMETLYKPWEWDKFKNLLTTLLNSEDNQKYLQ